MYAIEFQTNIKDGSIEIPEQYKGQFKGSVRVIVLAQPEQQTSNLIDQLLENPIRLDNFQPLTRQEIYE